MSKVKPLTRISASVRMYCNCCGARLSSKDIGDELLRRVIDEVYAGNAVKSRKNGVFSFSDSKGKKKSRTLYFRISNQLRKEKEYGRDS
jgi:hypothetical protein